MQHKRLVLDANILICGVLVQRVRQLIADSYQDVAFYVAEANYDEAEHYLAELATARGVTETIWQASLENLMTAVQ
jgi:hypothetical protein